MSVNTRIAVAGLGYWGPNLARNFHGLPGAELVWCCDASDAARARASALLPGVRMTDRFEDLLEDRDLDAIVLATPVPTHATLAVEALRAGKHCFVEKPLASNVADAKRAVTAAEQTGRILMVGHLLEYHPGVGKLKELAVTGALGDIRCVYGNRLNLGKLRADENALWSLGAHDISVLLYILDEEPCECFARGESFLRPNVEDVVFCFLRFPSGIAAHLHLSWLDPHKERRFTVVGSRRMATFDDTASEGKLTIYDKGFDEDSRSYGEYTGRNGGMFSPQISSVEPLRLECEHFLDAIQRREQPRSDGQSGLRVVQVLERLQAELIKSRRAIQPRAATKSPLLHSPPIDLGATHPSMLENEFQRFVGVTRT
jgi:predicted dehydrogenase